MIWPAKRLNDFHYAIRDIVAAAENIERRGGDVIRLNIGDPQSFGFKPPESVIEPVLRAIKDRYTGYSNSAGLYEAREAVANYASQLGEPVSPEEVIMTSGASEAADLVLTALLDPGDEVLVPAPGYPIYPAVLTKLGAVPRYYQLNPENGWRPSIENVMAAVNANVRAIVVINPNNPTGSVTPDETTSQIIEVAQALNLIVISDEVYRDLCFDAPPTAASVLAQTLEVPVVTLESLSKTHMLSGWRVGWMRFTNAEMMQELVSTVTKLASGRLCSPTPAQYAVKPALDGDNQERARFVSEIKRRRDLAVSKIESIDRLSCTIPDGAFYLIVRADTPKWLPDDRLVMKILEEAGVLVVPGSGFGCDAADGYFRMVYLADDDTLTDAFDRIGRFTHQ